VSKIRKGDQVVVLSGRDKGQKGESKEGDTVQITPCRPLSRRKSWKLLKVVERAGA
jgi:ribosomal protein S17